MDTDYTAALHLQMGPQTNGWSVIIHGTGVNVSGGAGVGCRQERELLGNLQARFPPGSLVHVLQQHH